MTNIIPDSNITLDTILKDFEEYYQFKYNKKPKFYLEKAEST